MRLTLDSGESLEDALRVVGALYNVQLSVTGDTPPDHGPTGSADTSSQSAGPRAGTAPTSGGKRRRQRKPRQRSSASNADIRSWANDNGYQVSDRGRIPAAVVAAYNESRSA